MTIIDPRNIGEAPLPPTVRIESIAADTRSFDTVPPLQLPARTSHLQIGFAALRLSDPMRVRYRYRLAGYDRDWVDVARPSGDLHEPPASPIPVSGHRERRRRELGEPSAALAFGIRPMFYQTGWFYLVCGLTVFLIVYMSWRLHVRRCVVSSRSCSQSGFA